MREVNGDADLLRDLLTENVIEAAIMISATASPTSHNFKFKSALVKTLSQRRGLHIPKRFDYDAWKRLKQCATNQGLRKRSQFEECLYLDTANEACNCLGDRDLFNDTSMAVGDPRIKSTHGSN